MLQQLQVNRFTVKLFYQNWHVVLASQDLTRLGTICTACEGGCSCCMAYEMEQMPTLSGAAWVKLRFACFSKAEDFHPQ